MDFVLYCIVLLIKVKQTHEDTNKTTTTKQQISTNNVNTYSN